MAAVWIALALALGLARAEEPERAIPTLEGLASAPGASGLERTYREGIPEHLRVTAGTEPETTAFLTALEEVLGETGHRS